MSPFYCDRNKVSLEFLHPPLRRHGCHLNPMPSTPFLSVGRSRNTRWWQRMEALRAGHCSQVLSKGVLKCSPREFSSPAQWRSPHTRARGGSSCHCLFLLLRPPLWRGWRWNARDKLSETSGAQEHMSRRHACQPPWYTGIHCVAVADMP